MCYRAFSVRRQAKRWTFSVRRSALGVQRKMLDICAHY
jgi:hypothetical protein